MKNINEMDSHVNQNESSNQVSGKVRRSFRRFIRVAIVLLLLVGGAFFYVRYYFVFGSGVKAGTLNYVVKKGYVFKTYEGILIMEGFRTESRGTLQSNQFVFSVDNANLADSLMRLSGRHVELKYNEYLGAFLCCGKMPGQVLERYKMMQEMEDSPRIRKMIQVYEEGMLHPDEADLDRAARFTREVLEKLQKAQTDERD